MAKKAAAKSLTKTEFLNALAEANDMSRKQAGEFIDSLANLIGENLSKSGPGVINIPGLMKVKVVRKEATPAKKNVPNPFKPGEMMDVAAKPARNVVKILALKALKDMV